MKEIVLFFCLGAVCSWISIALYKYLERRGQSVLTLMEARSLGMLLRMIHELTYIDGHYDPDNEVSQRVSRKVQYALDAIEHVFPFMEIKK